MRQEQVLERHARAPRQHMFDVLLDDGEVLGMTSVGENGSRAANHHVCGVVAVIDLAIIELAEAVAQPPHARSDLAWHRPVARRQWAPVGHRLPSNAGAFSLADAPQRKRSRGMYRAWTLLRSRSQSTASSTSNCFFTASRPFRMAP